MCVLMSACDHRNLDWGGSLKVMCPVVLNWEQFWFGPQGTCGDVWSLFYVVTVGGGAAAEISREEPRDAAEGPALRTAAPHGKEFPGPAVSSAGVERP